MEGPALCGFLLGLLVSPLLSLKEDSLERRHDTRLVNTDTESGVEKLENCQAAFEIAVGNKT